MPYQTPIFVGGAPKSGLALIQTTLDNHENITCGPDLMLLPSIVLQWQDIYQNLGDTHEKYFSLPPTEVRENFATFIASLFDNLMAKKGKQRVAEKSSINALIFPQLNQLFPNSPLIHVLRDGRDVVSCLLEMNWTDPKNGQPLPYTQNIEDAARYWLTYATHARQAGKNPACKEQYFELRYEDLIQNPAPTLKKFFNFLQEPWQEQQFDFHLFEQPLAAAENINELVPSHPMNVKSIGQWQNKFKSRDKEIFKAIAGDLLIDLGYANDNNW